MGGTIFPSAGVLPFLEAATGGVDTLFSCVDRRVTALRVEVDALDSIKGDPGGVVTLCVGFSDGLGRHATGTDGTFSEENSSVRGEVCFLPLDLGGEGVDPPVSTTGCGVEELTTSWRVEKVTLSPSPPEGTREVDGLRSDGMDN
jgi:hypothetical protein